MNITGLSGRMNDWGKTMKQVLHRLGFQSVAKLNVVATLTGFSYIGTKTTGHNNEVTVGRILP